MWKRYWLMAPDDDKGGGGGGGQGGAGSGDGTGKPGAGDGKGDAGGILKQGAAGAGGSDDKGVKPGAGAGTGDAGKTYNWAENVPGTGEPPPWFKHEKYKTIADQARAAPELEAKLGPAAEFFGAPKDDKGAPVAYKLPEIKDDKGNVVFEWDAEDPRVKGFQEFAQKRGLSQKGFDEILSWYAGVEGEQHAAAELELSEALGKLGNNVAQRVAAVQKYVTAQVGEEGFAALDQALGTNVEAFKAFEKLIALQANDARLAGSGGKPGVGFSRGDIEKEQFKTYESGPLKGQRIYDHDKEHRAKVDGMWSQLFPGEDVQNVG
jgi:hypothetical protein